MRASPVAVALALLACGCSTPRTEPSGSPVVEAPRAAAAPSRAPSPAAPVQRPSRRGLRLGATCRDAEPCVWAGGDLFLTIRVGNGSDVPVELPVAYLRRTGPSIVLTDARTGAELQLRTNPGPEQLLHERAVVQPGKAEVIEWVIHESELVHHGTPVDLTARITLFGVMREGEAEIPFEATTTLAIRSRPTAAR